MIDRKFCCPEQRKHYRKTVTLYVKADTTDCAFCGSEDSLPDIEWSCWENKSNYKMFREFVDLMKEGEPIDKEDGYQLCFYRNGKWSVYLAVYEGVLTWTLSEHFKDEGETYADGWWENEYEIDFDLETAGKSIKQQAKEALAKSIKLYQKK